MVRKKSVPRSFSLSLAVNSWPAGTDPFEAVTELAMEGPAPYLVRRLQQVVSAIFAEEMERFDVTAPQYAALSVVVALPNLDQETTAFLAGVERTTIVGVINRLVKKGLLKRTLSKTDKRVRLIQPTAAGTQFVHEVSEGIQRIGTRLLEPLPSDQQIAFCNMIKVLLRPRLLVEAGQLNAHRVPLNSSAAPKHVGPAVRISRRRR